MKAERVRAIQPWYPQIYLACHFREHGSDAVTYRVEASEPPRRRLVRIAETNLPYGGTWTYDQTPGRARFVQRACFVRLACFVDIACCVARCVGCTSWRC